MNQTLPIGSEKGRAQAYTPTRGRIRPGIKTRGTKAQGSVPGKLGSPEFVALDQ